MPLPTCKPGCICLFITTRAYRDLPCREWTELKHNHSLTDGETEHALQVLTEGGWGGSSHEQILTHFLAIKAESPTERGLSVPSLQSFENLLPPPEASVSSPETGW